MIAPFENGRLLRAAQEEIVLLKQQLAALLAQVAALGMQVAAEAERTTLAEAQALLMRERLDALQAEATLQSAAADRQNNRLDALSELASGNEEALKQRRGDLTRIEKQIQADQAEWRHFSADLASMLLQGRSKGSKSNDSC